MRTKYEQNDFAVYKGKFYSAYTKDGFIRLRSYDIKDVEENRGLALLKALDYQMVDFGSADGGVSAMPVYDFIQAYMDNCVGYDENYVLPRALVKGDMVFIIWVNELFDKSEPDTFFLEV